MTLWSICGTFTENKHYFYMYISVHAGAFSLNTTVMFNLQTSRRANMLWFLVITELFYDLSITNLNVHFLNIIIWFKKKKAFWYGIHREAADIQQLLKCHSLWHYYTLSFLQTNKYPSDSVIVWVVNLLSHFVTKLHKSR